MNAKNKANNFDVFEPKPGHKERFLLKLQQNKAKKSKKNRYNWMVAASILIFLGLGLGLYHQAQNQHQETAVIQQNQDYFMAIIQTEIKEIEQENTHKTQNIFEDAMKQIQILENDYQKLINDYKINHDKFILNAMIENFNQRILVLKNLKSQIEEIKKIKPKNHETHRA